MKYSIITILIIFSITGSYSQGLPPGWEHLTTPSSHAIAVTIESNPIIDGLPIDPGDYIGVFYFRDGVQFCGGAFPWDGVENIAVVAFGDDSSTSEKDGFSTGETFNWRIYSWSQGKNYEAEVIYDISVYLDTTFIQYGLAELDDISVVSLSVSLSAGVDTICDGQTTQLFADPAGGSGNYFYAWSSDPSGFSSNDQNPVVAPDTTTKYYLQLNNYADTIIDSITIHVKPTLPDVLFLQNETILGIENYYAVHIEAGSSVTGPPQGPFIVENGAVVGCIAGLEIKLKDGFHARTGSIFHARIDTVYCPEIPDPEYNQSGYARTESITNNSFVNFNYQETQFVIYPNPANEIIYIDHTNQDAISYQLELLDIYGNILIKVRDIASANYILDLSNVSAGIYLIKFTKEDKINTEKIIVK
jgi:hypothetical protein